MDKKALLSDVLGDSKREVMKFPRQTPKPKFCKILISGEQVDGCSNARRVSKIAFVTGSTFKRHWAILLALLPRGAPCVKRGLDLAQPQTEISY